MIRSRGGPGPTRSKGLHRSLVLLGFLGLLLWAAVPGATRAADPPHRWTVDDLVTAERTGGWALAPDGSFAVWVKTTVETVDDEEQSVDRLWWTPLGETPGESRQLTRGAASLGAPRISPDGQRVAFVTDREPPKGTKADKDRGKRQIWVLPLHGGEAFPVTGVDRAVQGFDWAGPKNLVFAAPESPSAEELERKEGDDTAVVVEDPGTPPVRLFTVDLDGQVKRLTENDDWIDGLSVSPDGRWAVVSAQQSLSYTFDSKVPPDFFLVDLETGERTELELTETLDDGTERELLPQAVRWALDGSGLYLADAFTNHPRYRTATVTRIHYLDRASGQVTRVPLDWDRGVGGDFEATRDGFLALLADGVRNRPARYVKQGGTWQRQDLTGEHAQNLDGWKLSLDGETVVYEHSTATKPPQYYAATLDGARLTGERQITELNASYEKKPTGRVEVIRFEGALGDTVEGLLHYPLDWQEGTEPRPLVLDIHGGPAGTDRDSWDQRWASPNILWRQNGAFVLQVNYHGSAGYGLDWVESIERRYYELEIPDLEAGVDHVIAQGLADPERLATTGWSNGGILSAELVTRTDRYDAAIIGAADVEWISDWANVDFGASFDNFYFGGPPWEIPEVYLEKSPFFRLSEVEAPVLIHTGTEDRNVPPHQSWSLFRALQQMEKVPVKLVLYPGEPHGLRKPAHQRRKVTEDVAWLEEHLFGTKDDDNPAVRDGSPLSRLLATAEASRVNGAFGREHQGSLVPETVSFRGHEVGRFEVTRAQWKAFRDEYEVEGGTENLPVTGVSFEDARAYAAWLSETTGESYRLPTVEEAEAWAKAAGGGGVTLDRWAGYSPNPEDRERLLDAAAEIGPTALLEPVGSVAGIGEPAVFDLNGNAAEWAVTDDATGKAVGLSADRVSDSRSATEPGSAYVGLRVIHDIQE